MENLKKASKILILISGIIETLIAFVFYWTIYGIKVANNLQNFNTYPMIVLLFGILGGVLLFVSSFYIKETRLFGLILSSFSTALTLVATIYMICNINNKATADITMVFLPLFVVSNALALAGCLTLVASSFAKKEN